jgi:hypothetical protein
MRIRILAKSAYYLCQCPRLSDCAHVLSAAPTGRTSAKFDIEDFDEELSKNPKFV